MTDISKQDRVLIFDTTLRDGEQSPGATMTLNEKIEIASMLDEMGVDIIEAGFPIASEGDFEAVTEIAKAASVTRARNVCDNVQWSPMDATRTEEDYLCRTVEIAIKAGATTINIPDTVGYTAPRNTALEEVVMALRVRNDIMPYQTGVDTTKIMGLSRLVSTVSGFPVQFNKAIVGKNAFAHESGIHQDGMLKNAESFEIMRPEDIGLTETNLVMGKHSGRAALRSKLENLGYELGDNQLKDVFVRFKALADRKKEVYDEDLIALMTDSNAGPTEDQISIKSLRVICGTEGPQSADLTLLIDGRENSVTAEGDGPVDATFAAIKALVKHSVKLQLYQVHAVTEGTDAQATVSVRMEEDGKIVTGQSSDTDTVVASAKAYINALNKLMVKRLRTAPPEESKSA